MALDANKQLLDAASELGRAGSLETAIPSTGGSTVTEKVSLNPEANPGRVTFKQCDPMCLPAGMAGEKGIKMGIGEDEGMYVCVLGTVGSDRIDSVWFVLGGVGVFDSIVYYIL